MKSVHELTDSGGVGSQAVILEQTPTEASLDPVLGLVGRTACDQQEPLLVSRPMAAKGLGDVGAHGVRASNELHAHRPLVERAPAIDRETEFVGQCDGALIRDQILKARYAYASQGPPRTLPRATSNEQRATTSGAST
jgi:hypothetical protein